jgi:hypothetical protein
MSLQQRYGRGMPGLNDDQPYVEKRVRGRCVCGNMVRPPKHERALQEIVRKSEGASEVRDQTDGKP